MKWGAGGEEEGNNDIELPRGNSRVGLLLLFFFPHTFLGHGRRPMSFSCIPRFLVFWMHLFSPYACMHLKVFLLVGLVLFWRSVCVCGGGNAPMEGGGKPLSVVALCRVQGLGSSSSRGRRWFCPGDSQQGGGGGCCHGNLKHLLILNQSNESFEVFQRRLNPFLLGQQAVFEL